MRGDKRRTARDRLEQHVRDAFRLRREHRDIDGTVPIREIIVSDIPDARDSAAQTQFRYSCFEARSEGAVADEIEVKVADRSGVGAGLDEDVEPLTGTM